MNFRPVFWDGNIILALFSFACAMGGTFILNQIKDIDSDKKNQKLFLLGDGFIPPAHAYIESVLLILLSLISAHFFGNLFLLTTILFIFVTGYMYNYPPFEYKSYPIKGLIANMFMGWFAFVLGWLLVSGENISTMLTKSIPYLFYNTALYLLTTAPDFEGDKASNKQTIAVRYGLKSTIRASFFLLCFSLLVAFILKDAFLLLICIIAFPFFFRMLYQYSIPTAIIAVKMGIFFFSIGVCIKFPLFGLAIIAAYALTKFYYQHRFNVNYPNFKGH